MTRLSFSPCGVSSSPSSAWPSYYRPAPRLQWHRAPLAPSSSCRQRLVSDTPSDRRINKTGQPIQRMALHLAVIQAEGELVDIAAQVLDAGMVVDAMQAALHHGPHALNTVRMDLTAYPFLLVVIDGLVRVEDALESIVAHVLVSMEYRASRDMRMDGRPQVGGIRVLNGLGNRSASTFPHPHNGGFIQRPALVRCLGVRVLILLFPPDVRFVHFDDSAQHGEIVTARFAQPLQYKPRAFLRNADFLGQLQGRNTFARGDEQVHGVQPLMQRDMRPLEDRAGANREIQLTGVAAVEAVLTGRNPLAFGAGRAGRPFRPQSRFKVGSRRFLIGKHTEKLKGADRDLVHGSLRCY